MRSAVSPVTPQWYLIRTKSWSETPAETHLERQGYEVYLPRVMQPARSNGRWRDRILPLFPGYLFLRLNEDQALAPVHSTLGVANVVRFGSRYAIVPPEVIGEMRSRVDPDTGLHRLSVGAPWVRGMPVRVTAGPFDGLEAIFQRQAGAERVVVLLKLLGQSASVCVPSDVVVLRHAI